MLDREQETGFIEFVRARSAGLLATAYLLTGDAIYAENLVRTALIRAILGGASFDDLRPAEPNKPAEPAATIEAVVRRHLLAMAGSRWWALVWRRSPPGLEEPPMRGPRSPTSEAAKRDLLWEAFETLPYAHRMLLVLQHHDGLSEAETADLTASTVEAVRAQTTQSLNALPERADVNQPSDRTRRMLRDLFAERIAEVEWPLDWAEQTLRHVRRVRRSGLAVPVAAAAVALVASIAALLGPGMDAREQAPARVGGDGLSVALARLPAGSPPEVPYAVGRTIVLAPDRTVELPGTHRKPGVFGLAGTRNGLLLVPPGIPEYGTRVLHLAGDGAVTPLDAKAGSYAGHVISPDGGYAAWTTRTGNYDEPVFAKIADLRTGDIIASRQLPRNLSAPSNDLRVPRVLAFDGERAVLAGANPAGEIAYAHWDPADDELAPQHGPRGLRTIWAGVLSADTLLATVEDTTGDRCLVNVALSDPDRERWRLCDGDREYVPYLSPDASLVALRRVDEDPAHRSAKSQWDHRPISLGVHDVETGRVRVRQRVEAPEATLWAPSWESNRALLIVVRRPAGQPPHLVRCHVSEDDRCARVSIPEGDGATAVAVRHWHSSGIG